MHSGKCHTRDYKAKQAVKNDRIFGPETEHVKTCETCEDEFIWFGRIKTKGYERVKYCSRSCANNRSAWWKEKAVGLKKKFFRL